MVSDSILNASVPNASKDLGKKKRTNRSAKLKQCKLDARREQWLSQDNRLARITIIIRLSKEGLIIQNKMAAQN